VPLFEPFHALRYSPTVNLAEVCAQPYDVQSNADRETFARRSKHNIVHLDLPIGDDPYRRAGENLEKWKDNKTLIVDEAPSFTIYRMRFVDSAGVSRRTTGVIGALRIEPADSKEVMPHEQTTPKAKTDRLELTRATRANLSPIWALSLTPGLTTALVEPAELVGSFTDENSVEHRVERVTNSARCAVISGLVAQHPVVIADGHHRYAISRSYRDENPRVDFAKSILCYVNELVDEQLSVAAIHRLYSGVSSEILLEHLERYFEIQKIAPLDSSIIGKMSRDSFLTFASKDGACMSMKPKPELFSGVRNLDSALLEHALRECKHSVAYQHGFTEVQARLAEDEFTAAVLIRPVSVAEIQRTATEGLLMPPKSTFFTPKLQTGLVLRQLVD